MNKVILVFVMILVFIGFSYAQEICDVDVSILNQDPFPAVPGDIVKIVFALNGLDTDNCGVVNFEVFEEYPFSIMPYDESKYVIQSGTYNRDYSSDKTIPIDFRISEDALDGDNPLEVGFKSSLESVSHTKKFNIEVQDVRAKFEIFVSNYDYVTKDIKFEVLNIGKVDIEAVTVEIPTQDGIRVYGQNKENIGDLSSNEDTSADFRVDVNSENILLLISYSDSIQERRIVESNVIFDGSLFEVIKAPRDNTFLYWGIGILVLFIIFYFNRKRKKHVKR